MTVSRLRRGVVAVQFGLAIVGPVAGAMALLFGELPLWQAPNLSVDAPAARAGIWLGTWPTLACLGLLVASPVRLWVAYVGKRQDAHAWAALTVAAVVGCLDLSAGPLLLAATIRLWRLEGPLLDEQGAMKAASVE